MENGEERQKNTRGEKAQAFVDGELSLKPSGLRLIQPPVGHKSGQNIVKRSIVIVLIFSAVWALLSINDKSFNFEAYQTIFLVVVMLAFFFYRMFGMLLSPLVMVVTFENEETFRSDFTQICDTLGLSQTEHDQQILIYDKKDSIGRLVVQIEEGFAVINVPLVYGLRIERQLTNFEGTIKRVTDPFYGLETKAKPLLPKRSSLHLIYVFIALGVYLLTVLGLDAHTTILWGLLLASILPNLKCKQMLVIGFEDHDVFLENFTTKSASIGFKTTDVDPKSRVYKTTPIRGSWLGDIDLDVHDNFALVKLANAYTFPLEHALAPKRAAVIH
jgi:hypothetical protein